MSLIRAMAVAMFALAFALPVQAGKMAKSKEPLVVAPDKATIVFMRPGKFVGAAVGVPVYDATGEAPKFIGVLDAGSKVAWQVPPGEHVFMTTIFGGDAGVRFYKAQVEAGKTYYFRAHIIQGIWGLEPVRGTALEGKEFMGWNQGTVLTVNTPKSLAWADANQAEATRKHTNLEPKSISEENTLRIEDGR
jgi:hypothetical protein